MSSPLPRPAAIAPAARTPNYDGMSAPLPNPEMLAPAHIGSASDPHHALEPRGSGRYVSVAVGMAEFEIIDGIRKALNESVCWGAQHFGAGRVLELLMLRHRNLIDELCASGPEADEPPLAIKDLVAATYVAADATRGTSIIRCPPNAKQQLDTIREALTKLFKAHSVSYNRNRLCIRTNGGVSCSLAIRLMLRLAGPVDAWGFDHNQLRDWLRSKPMRGDHGRQWKGQHAQLQVLNPKRPSPPTPFPPEASATPATEIDGAPLDASEPDATLRDR